MSTAKYKLKLKIKNYNDMDLPLYHAAAVNLDQIKTVDGQSIADWSLCGIVNPDGKMNTLERWADAILPAAEPIAGVDDEDPKKNVTPSETEVVLEKSFDSGEGNSIINLTNNSPYYAAVKTGTTSSSEVVETPINYAVLSDLSDDEIWKNISFSYQIDGVAERTKNAISTLAVDNDFEFDTPESGGGGGGSSTPSRPADEFDTYYHLMMHNKNSVSLTFKTIDGYAFGKQFLIRDITIPSEGSAWIANVGKFPQSPIMWEINCTTTDHGIYQYYSYILNAPEVSHRVDASTCYIDIKNPNGVQVDLIWLDIDETSPYRTNIGINETTTITQSRGGAPATHTYHFKFRQSGTTDNFSSITTYSAYF